MIAYTWRSILEPICLKNEKCSSLMKIVVKLSRFKPKIWLNSYFILQKYELFKILKNIEQKI